MQSCVGLGACLVVLIGTWASLSAASDQKPASEAISSAHPVLAYSTILDNPADRIAAVAAGRDGTLYLAGTTLPDESNPTGLNRGARQGKPFVARLSADGSSLVFRVYLENGWQSEARGIAVDGEGNAYVTGETRSSNFPVQHALQQSCGMDGSGECQGNAFLVKVNSHGTVVFSTYLGGAGEDAGSAVAVDDAGNAYVAGVANSADFPVVNPLQDVSGGNGDAFLAEVAKDGSKILFATYLGGTGHDEARAIALDRPGNIYVTGETKSSDFPTQDAFQNKCLTRREECIGEAFVTKISAAGKVVFSTYLGGSGGDYGAAVGVDATGIYVTGSTKSKDFPTMKPVQQTLAGNSDAFLTRIALDGSKVVFSTYLGGQEDERAKALALDDYGRAVIIGWTRSADFPTQNALQSKCGGTIRECSADAFVAVVDTRNQRLLFSTYLGGSATDVGESVAMDSQGSVYLGGWTRSRDFPQVLEPTPSEPSDQKLSVQGGSFAVKIAGILPANPTVTCSGSTNNWSGNAGNNQWTTASNWSDSRVPISTDTVCIASSFTSRIFISNLATANQQIAGITTAAPITFSGGPLAISGSATFDSDLTLSAGVLAFNGFATLSTLELSGGTISGTSGITVNGLFAWSGGLMCTYYNPTKQACDNSKGISTTYANGGMNITTTVTIDSRRLNNAQTVSVAGAINVNLADGAIVNNQSGATWTLTSDANLNSVGTSTTQVFNNSGTFQKSGGTGTTTIQTVFNNTGTVQLNSAKVDIIGGQLCTGGCSGSWAVASGSTLQFDNNQYNLTGQFGGTGSAGAGSIDFATGSASLTGNYNISGATVIGTASVSLSGVVSNLGALSISGGLLDLAASSTNSITIPSLLLDGGTLASNDGLVVTGKLTWSDGAMCTTYSSTALSCVAPVTAATTTANGGITFGSGAPTLDGRILTNTQTATMSSAGFNSLTLLDGSVINNNTGATWNLTADANINGIASTFNNSGTFEKTAGISTSSIQPIFNNTGNVTVSAAALDFTGGGSCTGTCSGSWTASSGGALQFDSNFSMSGPVNGTGIVSFSSGAQVLTGTYPFSGTTNFSGAVVGFNQAGTVTFSGPINLAAGAVYGSATLAFNALLTWTYGTMCTIYSSTTASCALPANQAVTNANNGIAFPFGFPTLDGRTLNNTQTMSMTGSGYFFTLLDSAVIYNKAGATWNVAADTSISGSTGIVVNLGTFEKTGGTSVSTIQTVFHNAGAVLVNAATVDFAGGGSCNATCPGSWTVASGATLQFDSGSFALSGKFAGAGTATFNSGSQILTGGYTVTGTTNFMGAAVAFNETGPVTFAGPVNLLAGDVYGTAALTANGLLTWTNGGLCTVYSATTGACSAPGTQAVTNAVGGITFGAGLPTLDGRTLNNTGTATFTKNGSYLTLLDSAVINSSSTATWNFSVDASLKGSSGSFNNGGTFEKTGGSSTSSVAGNFTNTGTVQATKGTLSFSGTYTQSGGNTVASTGVLSFTSNPTISGGTISGSGTINGALLNSGGTLAPGTTQNVGVVTVATGYTQNSAASYTVKIGGTSQYDHLSLGGNASLSGTLKVTTINGFSPTKGQTFTIIRCKTSNGKFSSVTTGWSVTYNKTSIVLTFQ